MSFLNPIKILTSISVFIAAVMVLFDNYVEANSFCPPLKASKTTNLTCELPKDEQKIDCSSSWLPNGTIAHFQCFKENGDLRKGRMKCNGDTEFDKKEYIMSEVFKNGNNGFLPCDLYEDRLSPQIHFYGYKKPRHYPMPITTNVTDFRQIGLSLHNYLRHRHKADSLELDEQLNQKAQKWAEHLIKLGRLDMASEKFLGQNIFSSEFKNESSVVSDAIQNWYYGGSASYNWTNVSSNWNDPLALEFSQILWKSTRKLGFGAASRDPQGLDTGQGPSTFTTNTIIVAFYFPMGNIVLDDEERPEKLFLENVLPS